MTIQHQLIRHEGERLKPYMDCCGKSWRDCQCIDKGKLTIGVGRNLADVGGAQSARQSQRAPADAMITSAVCASASSRISGHA